MIRLVLAMTILAAPALAAEPRSLLYVYGTATVQDGDTLHVAGWPVRLLGVAAPEIKHPGRKTDEPGGQEAKAAMVEMIQGRPTVCKIVAADTRRRLVGICRRDEDGLDVGEELIRRELARSCPSFSTRYEAVDHGTLPRAAYCELKVRKK